MKNKFLIPTFETIQLKNNNDVLTTSPQALNDPYFDGDTDSDWNWED